MNPQLTLGPLLFNWNVDVWKDFYFRAADEMPVDIVYLGEVICSKRSPFFEEHYSEVAERLQKARKKVIFSTLAEIMIPRERKMTQSTCLLDDYPVEANDAAALFHLRGKPHYIGQYVTPIMKSRWSIWRKTALGISRCQLSYRPKPFDRSLSKVSN